MKNIILITSFLLPVILFAQSQSKDFTVSTGTQYPEVGSLNSEYFSDNMGNCILVKTRFQKVTIQHYDVTNMKEMSKNEYIDFPEEITAEKCIKTDNRLFYLYSVPNKSKTRTLYVREINMTTGAFMKQQLLFETKGPVEFVYSSSDGPVDIYYISTYFEVKKSFDQSKILIHYKRQAITKNNDSNFEVFGLYAFDANLTALWGSEKTMPYTEKNQNVLSFTIAKNGAAYMLTYTNDANNPRYEFFSTSQDASILKTKLDIDPQLLFQDIIITENSDGNILYTGYYNNSVDKKLVEDKPDLFYSLFLTNSWKYNTGGANGIITQNVNGVFRAKTSTQGTIIEKNMHEFPIELINQYETQISAKKNDKKEEKGKAGIINLLLFDVIENMDGSTLIIGEQKYMRIEHTVEDVTNANQPTLNGRTTEQTQRLYYAKNIVVTKINPTGQISWQIKLPKYQLSNIGMGSIGFKYVECNGMNYFLFLDNFDRTLLPNNTELPLFKVSDGGQLRTYQVDDSSGKYTNLVILDTYNVNGNVINRLPTTKIFNADKKTLLFEFDMKGKFDNMIKIKMN